MDSVDTILSRLKNLRVAVVGDFCLDIYLLVDDSAGETSIETGLSTKPVFEQRFSLGGAGNVATNLASLGVGTIEVFGVIGDDPYGREMRRIMESLGIDHGHLYLQSESWQTCAYTKIYHGDREEPRIDFGNFNRLSTAGCRSLLADLGRRLDMFDAVIINQQLEHGIHTVEVREGLNKLVESHHGILFITDSRHYSNEYNHTLRKINDYEGAVLCGNSVPRQETIGFAEARDFSRELYRRWGMPLFMTRGEFGALVADEAGIHEIPALLLLKQLDTVGAGDSMLAGIAAALGAGESPIAAARFGTIVDGVTVQKLRMTGTANPREVLDLAADASYANNPELALHREKAVYLQEDIMDIEVVAGMDAIRRRKGKISHIIFDHDGTISTLREGWPRAMEMVMMKAILGSSNESAENELLDRVRKRILHFIDQTTGVQTLVQMYGLVDLVAEFGCVPPHEILNAHQYKEVYDTALMEFVGQRITECAENETARGKYTISGAVDFVKTLYERDIKIYLASGTDEEDVRREATVLGYAGYFAAIVGARGDVAHEPKRVALRTIFEIVGDGGSDCIAVIGDGPVEIREAKRCGAFAIGVASDEINPNRLDAAKRKRLILAGADLIISDFRSMDRLLNLIF